MNIIEQKPQFDYSINYTTIDSYYCSSKSAVALCLNITHNWFGDIRTLCTAPEYLTTPENFEQQR